MAADGPGTGGPRGLFRGKALGGAAGLVNLGGVAGGVAVTPFDAGLVRFTLILGLSQLSSLVILGMRWGRQRHEQRMERERNEQYLAITAKAADNPRDEHLRSLMRDFTETCPGYGDRRGDEEPGEDVAGDSENAKKPPGRPMDAPPTLTSVDRPA